MGFIPCDYCGHDILGCREPHVCKKEDILANITSLENQARTAVNNLDLIRDQVLKLVVELPDLNGDYCTVKTDLVRKIWEAAECQWYDNKKVDTFLIRWIAMHTILTAAFRLFKSKPRHSLKDKLAYLLERCDNAKEVFGYQDSVFDLSVEDLIKELKP